MPLFRIQARGTRPTATFSFDGNRILLVSTNDGAQIRDGRTGQVLVGPLPHDGQILLAGFNPNGTQVVTVSDDQTARIWDTQTGQPVTPLLGHESRVNAADLHADSYAPLIALALDNAGNVIVVWEDYRNDPSKGDIYAQKMDTNGNRLWLNEVRVNSDSGIVRHANPAIAADSTGNVVVAWDDLRNGNSDVFAQRLNASGIKQWVASDVQLN